MYLFRQNLSGKHRGFGFVEFEEEEDAAAAIENMDDAELLGRVLKVNVAKPMAKKLGASRAGWIKAIVLHYRRCLLICFLSYLL